MADETSIASITYDNYATASGEHDKGHVADYYKVWVQNGQYDKDTANAKHHGTIMMADEFEQLFTKDRDKIRIVDIGAGTGNGAIELRRRGYNRIDSVEPVPEMSNYAKERTLYGKYICDFVSNKPLDIEEGTYDAAVCVGLLTSNHLPPESIQEMLRIIKTGGYIIIVGAECEYYRLPELHRDLAQEMYRLETENKMRIIKRERKDGYMQSNKPFSKYGMIFVIKKL